MSNGAGIQELMAAETRASQIVAEARIGKKNFFQNCNGLVHIIYVSSRYIHLISLNISFII
jgi:hypothetical protein